MIIASKSIDGSKIPPLTLKHAVFGLMALVITIAFMVFAIIAWTVFLVDKQLEYRQYDLLVQLVWDYPRLATIATIILIAIANKHRFAKLAKIGAWCLAILVPGFWIAWQGALPIGHLLKHNMSFTIERMDDQIGSGIATSHEDRELRESMLCSTTLVPVRRPNHPADCEMLFYLQDRYANTMTRTFHVGIPLDSIYVCGYYSKEGILADDRSGEYVRVSGPFRAWVLNAMN